MGYTIMFVDHHKTAESKNAGITLSPLEYQAMKSYVKYYRILFPEVECESPECP